LKKINLNNSITVNKGFVKHAGIVTKKTKESVVVSLVGNVNCVACNAKSSCGISDSDTKTIEIFENQKAYMLHESVDVIMENDKGLKAVFYAYIFPFILLFSTLLISLNFIKEWQAGLLALFILVPYFLILYYSENYLRKEFKISLLKHN